MTLTRAGALLPILFVIWPLLAKAQTPAQPHKSAGSIELASGDVRRVDAQGRSRPATVGAAMRRGDILITGEDGELHVRLSDDSVLALRAQTRIELTAYRHRQRDDDTSVVTLAHGALRAISGWIGRRTPDAVRIETPTAVIGIRGTDHEAVVLLPGSPLGDAGTYDKVNHGATYLETPYGRVDLTPGQAGHAAPARTPVVLPSVPGFFRPTANEERLEGLHERMLRQPVGATGGNGESGHAATGNRAASGTATGTTARAEAGKGGGVQSKGETRVGARAEGLEATAAGSNNASANRVGAVGGK